MAYGPDSYNEKTQTPDQQALLGSDVGPMPNLMDTLPQQVPQMAPVSPVEAQGATLGGQGRLDPAMLMQLLSGPTQGQKYAQAAAGGVAFMRGQPNPVNAILEQQQQQQMGIATLLGRLQSQNDAHQLAQQRMKLDESSRRDDLQLRTRQLDRQENADQLTYLNAFKDNPSPIAQAQWAEGMSKISSKNGLQIPPEAFKQTLQVPRDIQDNIRGAIESGRTDEEIRMIYPQALTPGYLEMERGVMSNPAMRAKLGYKTDEELREKQYDLVTKKATAWATENGFKIDSPEFRGANAAFRAATGGKNIYDADPTSVTDLKLITDARVQGQQEALAQEAKKKDLDASYDREKMDYQHRLNMASAQARDAATESRQERRDAKKPLPGTWVDMEKGILLTPSQEEYALNGGSKRYRNPSATEEALLSRLTTAAPMARQIGKLIDGLLVDNTPDNLVNALKGKASQKVRNSPGWSQLENLLTERNVELTGALGSGQFRVTLMTYLQDAGVKTRDTREVAHIINDTIETSIQNRRMSIIHGGNEAKMLEYKNPLKPKQPAAGSKLIDGNWVSDDGKYIWKGGQWTLIN